MEPRHELHAGNAEILFSSPWSLADFFRFPVNQNQMARIVLKGNDASLVGKQVVDDLARQVCLLRKSHDLVVLLYLQNGDAVVGSENEVVVSLIAVVWHHLHRVDHAELVEEAAGEMLGLLLHLEKVKLARILCSKQVFVRLPRLAHRKLGCKDDHLRNLLTDFGFEARLEALIYVPVVEISLGAPSEEKIVRAGHAHRKLLTRFQVHDQAQIVSRQDVERPVWSIDSHMPFV